MCEHLCLLTRNTEDTGLGYRCGCEVGFKLRDDKMECAPVKEFLMYSQQKFIKGQVGGFSERLTMGLIGTDARLPFSSRQSCTCFDLFPDSTNIT